jgi:hypothetical protein
MNRVASPPFPHRHGTGERCLRLSSTPPAALRPSSLAHARFTELCKGGQAVLQFIVGCIAGAISGLLVSVLLEDYLLRWREFIARHARARWSRVIRHFMREGHDKASDLFSLGPLQTRMMIVEGDGEQVIDEQNIHIIIESQPVKLPDELAVWRREILREQRVLTAEAKQHFWNGQNYAISSFSVARKITEEEPEIFFRLKTSDYATFLATQQLDRPFKDGSTPRTRYLNPHRQNLLNVPDFMSSSFGTNAAVLTADGFFIFAKRSEIVGSRPNVWSSSANEALSRTLDDRGRSAPNLYDVMRRGISEELAIQSDEYSLELLSIRIDAELNQWGGDWLAVLRGLTGEEVLERRTRGAADKWEHTALCLVAADPEKVLEFVLDKSFSGEMAPHTPCLFYFALVRRFGRHTVEHSLKRVLRNRRWEAGYGASSLNGS